MKDRITNILLVIIVVLLGVYIYIALRDRGIIELKVNAAVREAVASEIKAIPLPKDGKNATNTQVEQAVTDYLKQYPPKRGEAGQNGTDGQDGRDGKDATDEQVQKAVDRYMEKQPKTQILQCNTVKNRWEVKYSPKESWQLLDGQILECAMQ